MEIASNIIKIGAKLSTGQHIESEEVKCRREMYEPLAALYPAHLQTIEALYCTS